MHIQSGKHVVGDNAQGFEALQDGEGRRHFDHIVKFEQKFDDVPHVLVALNYLDVTPHALKLHVSAEEVSASGFVLRYSTWATAHVFGVGAQWTAFRAALSDFRLTGRIL